MRALLSILLAAGLAASAAAAPEAAALPAYQAGEPVAGTIRIWGDPAMAEVVRRWAEGFRRFQPHVTLAARLMSTATAMPGIYLGVADLALLGREPNTTDNDGFLHVTQYTPLRLELMTGSLDAPDKSPALAVFVHRDNPLAQLTLAQLAALFGCGERPGIKPVRTWGDLGLTGEWADRPIQLYSFDAETGTGLFFLHAVLSDSRKMNWPTLREFRDRRKADGSADPAAAQILRALRQDRAGIAVASLRFASPEVKPVALAAGNGGPFVAATRDSLISREYPLTRSTYAFVNRPPGRPLDPKVRELLRYILSREGQADIGREGDFLPLSPQRAGEQRRKLE